MTTDAQRSVTAFHVRSKKIILGQRKEGASMIQIAGSYCGICSNKITSILDGKKCDGCGHPVHHNCLVQPRTTVSLSSGDSSFCNACGCLVDQVVRYSPYDIISPENPGGMAQTTDSTESRGKGDNTVSNEFDYYFEENFACSFVSGGLIGFLVLLIFLGRNAIEIYGAGWCALWGIIASSLWVFVGTAFAKRFRAFPLKMAGIAVASAFPTILTLLLFTAIPISFIALGALGFGSSLATLGFATLMAVAFWVIGFGENATNLLVIPLLAVIHLCFVIPTLFAIMWLDRANLSDSLYEASYIHYVQGNISDEMHMLDRAIWLDSTNHEALNNLAWILATHPDPKIRDGSRAVHHAHQACEFSEWNDMQNIDTLAAAYAESGQYDKAIEFSSKALDAATDPEFRIDCEAHLKQFQDRKPWREEKAL